MAEAQRLIDAEEENQLLRRALARCSSLVASWPLVKLRQYFSDDRAVTVKDER